MHRSQSVVLATYTDEVQFLKTIETISCYASVHHLKNNDNKKVHVSALLCTLDDQFVSRSQWRENL